MHSPNSIMFEDPEDKETFRALSNNLLRLESAIKSRISFAISDITKYNECMLPLTLRQKKVETIFVSLDHATQALLKYNNDSATICSLLSSSTSKTRQSMKYINTRRESIMVMSESLTDSVDDLWHDFNNIVEVLDRENVGNIHQPPNVESPTEERDLRTDLHPGVLKSNITPPLFKL